MLMLMLVHMYTQVVTVGDFRIGLVHGHQVGACVRPSIFTMLFTCTRGGGGGLKLGMRMTLAAACD